MKNKTYLGISPFKESMGIGPMRTFLYIYSFARKYDMSAYIKCDDTNFNSRNNNFLLKQLSVLNDFGVKLTKEELNYFESSIIYQSKNDKIYLNYLNKLIKNGMTSEKDGLVSLDIKAFINKSGIRTLKINDLLKNNIYFNIENSGYSFIPLYSKTDKHFLFHIPCVVDEYLMDISISIRGEDKISIAPIHDMLRILFDIPPIQYLHLPLLLDFSTKKRLRGGDYLVDKFVSKYPKEVILSYLLSSGYNKVEKFWNIDNFIDKFDYHLIKKSSGFFKWDDINDISKIYYNFKLRDVNKFA
jgi:glutamyl-tRNA synthetase